MDKSNKVGSMQNAQRALILTEETMKLQNQKRFGDRSIKEKRRLNLEGRGMSMDPLSENHHPTLPSEPLLAACMSTPTGFVPSSIGNSSQNFRK